MNRISDYDEFKYDYKKYWEGRDYEDKSEKIIFTEFLKDREGKFTLDIGGSYGRLLSAYYLARETPVIFDLSVETLKKNKENILKKYPKTRLIAGNAYYLPFKDGSIDNSILNRVLHHIEDSTRLFREIKRVTRKNGLFILEFANKMHLKARIRWFLTLKFHNFSTKPYQQPAQGNWEGVKHGKEAIFLNFHPRNITETLQKNNFKILKKRNCSFFRINFLKKNTPTSILIFFEKIAQKLFSWTNITPSIILKTIQEKGEKGGNFEKLEDILCCPKCKEDLDISEKTATCKKCKKLFKKDDDIWDFRI